MKKNKFKIILVLLMFVMLLVSPVYASNINLDRNVVRYDSEIKIATRK